MDTPLLLSLEQKVDPKHTAIVVVDVLNDFCAKGSYFDRLGNDLRAIQAMVPRLVEFIDAARRRRVPVVFIRNNYDAAFLSANVKERFHRKKYGMPPCQPGTWGAEFYMVKPDPHELIVTKHRYDALEGTDLDVILRSKGIHTILLTGVTTECCVESTGRHAYMKGYYVVLVRDATGTYDPALQQMTERNVDDLFGVVADTDQVKEIWKRLGPPEVAAREREAAAV